MLSFACIFAQPPNPLASLFERVGPLFQVIHGRGLPKAVTNETQDMIELKPMEIGTVIVEQAAVMLSLHLLMSSHQPVP